MASNVEKPGKTHLRNVCELISHARRKDKQHNVEKALRSSPGKPLSRGPLESRQRKDMGEFFEYLASLWGIVKTIRPSTKNRKSVYLV